MKKLHLHRSMISKEEVAAIASATLQAGGWVELSTTPASVVDPPEIGEKMPDGTIYAGISPDTGKPMYAMPAAAPLIYTFNEAQKYAETTNAQKPHGHDDWRVPTSKELNLLFNNRAAIGGFHVSDSGVSGKYWSSSSGLNWGAWGQRFSDGFQPVNDKNDPSSVRLVRCEAQK